MGKATPQTIGHLRFDTKGAAEEFIQGILYRYDIKVPVTGDDHEFLMDLLKKHPKAIEKIGVGVKHFTIEPSKGGTRCFYVTRIDGSHDDFSYAKCLKN